MFTFTPMQWVYVTAAVIGGVVLLFQIIGSLLGADHPHDIGHDVHMSHDGESSGAASWLSFRAIIAFITFFGIGGMASSSAGWSSMGGLGTAIACGGVSFVLMRTALVQFDKLKSSGTVVTTNAIGSEAKVYLVIPAQKRGAGAVTVAIQGRTMQYKAITDGRELATGELCKVTAVHADDTLVVQAL